MILRAILVLVANIQIRRIPSDFRRIFGGFSADFVEFLLDFWPDSESAGFRRIFGGFSADFRRIPSDSVEFH
jgi:hypothetical protein